MKREDFEKARDLMANIWHQEQRISALKSAKHFECVLEGADQKNESAHVVEQARLMLLQDAEEKLAELLATLEEI